MTAALDFLFFAAKKPRKWGFFYNFLSNILMKLRIVSDFIFSFWKRA